MKPQENQKKRPWTLQEDQKLIDRVTIYGTQNWTQISKDAGLLRSGKSSRLRWMNYLRPDLKRGCFTKEEINCILHYHDLLGNKWSMIASHLPGRTDNEIKNFWHTYVRKCFKSDNVTKTRVQHKEPKKNKQKRKHVIMGSTSPGSEGMFMFPILESYSLKQDNNWVLKDVSEESGSISCLSETTSPDGDGIEEGWNNPNIFEEPFTIEDDFILGMNYYSSTMSFGYEFSSWENVHQDFSFQETSS